MSAWLTLPGGTQPALTEKGFTTIMNLNEECLLEYISKGVYQSQAQQERQGFAHKLKVSLLDTVAQILQTDEFKTNNTPAPKPYADGTRHAAPQSLVFQNKSSK